MSSSVGLVLGPNSFGFVESNSQLSAFETRPPEVQQHLPTHHDSCVLMSFTRTHNYCPGYFCHVNMVANSRS